MLDNIQHNDNIHFLGGGIEIEDIQIRLDCLR